MTLVFCDASTRVNLVPAGTGQFYLVASTSPGAHAERAAESIYRVIIDQLALNSAEVVHERVFGSLNVAAMVLGARQSLLADKCLTPVPPTYIEGAPPWGTGLAGVMIQAVSPGATQSGIQTLDEQSRPVGRCWIRDGVQQLVFQGLDGIAPGAAPDGSVGAEIETLFDRIERQLDLHGATLGDVTRTWFYLDDILAHYATFNRVRNARYSSRGLLRHAPSTAMLPASTGIGGKSSGKARVVADVLATRCASGESVQRLDNKTQQEPTNYGSSFCRAATVRAHGRTTIQLSGTAAIGVTGESLYPGNVEMQIDCTLTHVSSLLASQGATLSDMASATMFLKQPKHAEVLAEQLRRRGLETLPYVVVVADVCRDELLFELDAEVLVPELE
jgi:enamine deaminase RidA (YjgF/YER057c/UK114 family)